MKQLHEEIFAFSASNFFFEKVERKSLTNKKFDLKTLKKSHNNRGTFCLGITNCTGHLNYRTKK